MNFHRRRKFAVCPLESIDMACAIAEALTDTRDAIERFKSAANAHAHLAFRLNVIFHFRTFRGGCVDSSRGLQESPLTYKCAATGSDNCKYLFSHHKHRHTQDGPSEISLASVVSVRDVDSWITLNPHQEG